MEYKEFEVIEESMLGQRVWICDYRHNDFANKPIRHIKPTEAVVASNADLPENKRVYYTKTHFRPIGKKGTPLKQIISPYDNTGYRSYTGVSVNIFLKREECIDHYLKQCEVVKAGIEKERAAANDRFDKMTSEISKTMMSFK